MFFSILTIIDLVLLYFLYKRTNFLVPENYCDILIMCLAIIGSFIPYINVAITVLYLVVLYLYLERIKIKKGDRNV